MKRMSPLCLALIAAGFAATAAQAQVTIDSSAVLAGGITPGDAPGYPATLSVAGAYKLTGNLMGPLSEQPHTAIHITAANVDLDLNGFSVMATNVCDFLGPNDQGNTCVGAPTAPLILIEAPFSHVHDGYVEGSFGDGIQVASSPLEPGGTVLEDLQIVNNLGYGIRSSDDGTVVRNVLATFNGKGGILLAKEGSIESVRASRNNGMGIETGSSSVARQVISTYNGRVGLVMESGSATQIEASLNGADGFYGLAAVSFSRASANRGAGFYYPRMLTQSSATFNTDAGYVAPPSGGCYANLHVLVGNTNPPPPAISAGTGFVGTLAVCP
ncbi:hypothetical protein DFR29_102356 [Tahibacter aquaticus]|uniref:Parallel beta helix pectate lyase-like protein n=1 Tax=Tahibacter aquaticus TaxID=520092 RepID=A0A4V3DNA1_9GAMM|nr:hypothetical protein [Tahibacter aquaticus]TDR47696.1 hypothetical protein DFR29_102356 [Tahibacter aquaticus]